MLVEAAIAVDQHDLAVIACRSDANRRRQTGADRAEIDRDVILAGGAAAQMRHRKAEAMAAGDDDVPILWHCRVQLLNYRPRVERAGGRRIGLTVRVVGGRGNLRGDLVAAPALTADALFLEPAYDRLGGRLGVSLDMKVSGSQPLPQPTRLGVDPHHFGIRE